MVGDHFRLVILIPKHWLKIKTNHHQKKKMILRHKKRKLNGKNYIDLKTNKKKKLYNL